jgi:asparagine synthase (glutamine-hydrolysing)
LKSESDTEVLLYLYIIEGENCLRRLNGFFGLAIYDKAEQTVFIARDRVGVKPLLWYKDDDKLMFASEMKSLLAMEIPKLIDEASLYSYLQLNYIPGPHSIFKGVKKVEPGHYLKLSIKNNGLKDESYYSIPYPEENTNLSYDDAQKKLYELMDASVERRLISDVPLGTFLSGGIDSSIVSALAAKHTAHLKTFSIGFRDEPFFDETKYANLVARKIGSDHTVFSLTNDDLFNHLFNVLDYIDEPFADSSALNVYILSMYTRKHVTVALSGDGADELFGGYNKHEAERRARSGGISNSLIKAGTPLWKILPKSRNTAFGNKFRQLERFAEGLKLDAKERYWRWAGIADEADADKLLSADTFSDSNSRKEYQKRKNTILKCIEGKNLNEIFYTDVHLPLENDMLAKVDMMSMLNSQEVRTPFLDYTVIDFAFSLSADFKINATGRKRILRDSFRHLLPEELYTRKKQGFEVPLLKWFQTDLKPLITEDLLSEKLIREQNIFNYIGIINLQRKLFSNSPEDAVAQVWGLIVFQYWWKKYFN